MGPTSRLDLPQKEQVVTRRPRKPPGGWLPPPVLDGGFPPPPPPPPVGPPGPIPPPGPFPVRLLLGIATSPSSRAPSAADGPRGPRLPGLISTRPAAQTSPGTAPLTRARSSPCAPGAAAKLPNLNR